MATINSLGFGCGCTASSSSYNLFFVDGTNYNVWWAHSTDGTNYSGLVSLGGVVRPGDPITATSPGDGTIFLFCSANSNAYPYLNKYNGSSWSGWAQFGSPSTAIEQYCGVTCSSHTNGTVDAYYVAAAGGVYWSRWNGSSWTAFASIGGAIYAYTGITSITSATETVVAVIETDNGVWYKAYTGSWSSWTELSTAKLSGIAPTLSWDGTNLMAIICDNAGSNAVDYDNSVSGGAFGGWVSTSGAGYPVHSIGIGSDKTMLVIQGTNTYPYGNIWTGSWAGWTELSASLSCNLNMDGVRCTSLAGYGSGRGDVYWTDQNGNFCTAHYSGSSWSAASQPNAKALLTTISVKATQPAIGTIRADQKLTVSSIAANANVVTPTLGLSQSITLSSITVAVNYVTLNLSLMLSLTSVAVYANTVAPTVFTSVNYTGTISPPSASGNVVAIILWISFSASLDVPSALTNTSTISIARADQNLTSSSIPVKPNALAPSLSMTCSWTVSSISANAVIVAPTLNVSCASSLSSIVANAVIVELTMTGSTTKNLITIMVLGFISTVSVNADQNLTPSTIGILVNALGTYISRLTFAMTLDTPSVPATMGSTSLVVLYTGSLNVPSALAEVVMIQPVASFAGGLNTPTVKANALLPTMRGDVPKTLPIITVNATQPAPFTIIDYTRTLLAPSAETHVISPSFEADVLYGLNVPRAVTSIIGVYVAAGTGMTLTLDSLSVLVSASYFSIGYGYTLGSIAVKAWAVFIHSPIGIQTFKAFVMTAFPLEVLERGSTGAESDKTAVSEFPEMTKVNSLLDTTGYY